VPSGCSAGDRKALVQGLEATFGAAVGVIERKRGD
jgi:hypothetical protein